MKRKYTTKTIVVAAAVTLFALVALFMLTTATPIALASEEPSHFTGTHTVTVVGEGTVSIDPDIATATIGVEVLRSSVKEASADAQEVMENVLAALTTQGIAQKDIQTRHFSIYAERFGPEGLLADDQVRYRVSNTAFITIRDLDTIGAVLDAAIDAGANNIYGVDFRLADPAAVESQARAEAVADARSKAEELAELTGVTVGGVMSISEVIGQGGGFFGGNFSRMDHEMGGGGAGPISPGELTLTMPLQITYELR